MLAVVWKMMSMISLPALAQDMSNGADTVYKDNEVTTQEVKFNTKIAG
jgi:hypothetical protein